MMTTDKLSLSIDQSYQTVLMEAKTKYRKWCYVQSQIKSWQTLFLSNAVIRTKDYK